MVLNDSFLKVHFGKEKISKTKLQNYPAFKALNDFAMRDQVYWGKKMDIELHSIPSQNSLKTKSLQCIFVLNIMHTPVKNNSSLIMVSLKA